MHNMYNPVDNCASYHYCGLSINIHKISFFLTVLLSADSGELCEFGLKIGLVVH